MENYKVKVGSEAESKKVQELFFDLGYMVVNHMDCEKGYIVASKNAESPINFDYWYDVKNTITIPQLKDMVVLKRNDPKDSNVSEENCLYDLYLTDSGDLYFYHCGKNEWILSNLNGDEDYYKSLKPIEKPMKEFLVKSQDGKWRLETEVVGDPGDDIIEVPEGADTLAGDSSTRYFWKHGVGEKGNMIIGVGESLARYSGWTDCKDSADVWLDCVNDDSFKIIWQRETLPEALPFIDDEPKYDPEDIGIAKGYDLDELAKEYKFRDRYDGEADENYRAMLEQYISKETLNDKVASAEVARQEFIVDQQGVDFDNFILIDQPTAFDTQISGDHYKLLPIQPMKFCLANGLDYAQGNVIKYVIRHASKGGKDDLLKAIHNIELMIEHYYG